MKIVIASDSYKECLSSLEVAKEIESGFKVIFPDDEYVKIPIADGGEGTVKALVEATNGTIHILSVTGPLGKPVHAFYGLSGDKKLAFIEMAAASGLSLVPKEERNPLITTSYGTGELIHAALETGVRHLIIGIGGSATNDGGAGMLQALGFSLLDENNEQIPHGGVSLTKLHRIDATWVDPRLAACKIDVACDVNNPLCGPQGASAIFGPQKGATPEMIKTLDIALQHFAKIIKRDLSIDVLETPGSGAAGGMGAALLAFLKAQLRPGTAMIGEAAGLEEAIRTADLVITGEGCLDLQTLSGKTPVGVAQIAKKYGKPVVAVAGALSDDAGAVHPSGIHAIFSVLHKPQTLEEAILPHVASANIFTASRNVAAAIKLGLRLAKKSE